MLWVGAGEYLVPDLVGLVWRLRGERLHYPGWAAAPLWTKVAESLPEEPFHHSNQPSQGSGSYRASQGSTTKRGPP